MFIQLNLGSGSISRPAPARYHGGSVQHHLIVWDCDAASEAEKARQEIGDSKNVTTFAFKKRNNPIAPKGIENQYDEKYFHGFATRSESESTGVISRSMSNADKSNFANYVSSEGTKELFNHFGELHDVVREILRRKGSSSFPAKLTTTSSSKSLQTQPTTERGRNIQEPAYPDPENTCGTPKTAPGGAN